MCPHLILVNNWDSPGSFSVDVRKFGEIWLADFEGKAKPSMFAWRDRMGTGTKPGTTWCFTIAWE